MQLWNKRCHELVRWMCVSIYMLQFYTKPNKINEGIVVSLISKGKHTREFRRHPSSQYFPSIIASIHVSAGNVAKWIDNCVSVHQYKMMNWERYTVNKTEFAENNIIFVNQKRLPLENYIVNFLVILKFATVYIRFLIVSHTANGGGVSRGVETICDY